MDFRKEDLPATIQAYDLIDNNESFLAEQVVNNQSEIDLFTSRYAGKLIKAKTVVPPERLRSNGSAIVPPREKGSGSVIAVIIVVVILALLLYGYSTGWLQAQLHLKP